MFIKLCTEDTSGELVNTDNICSVFQQGNNIKILFTGKDNYENYLFSEISHAEQIFKELQKALVKFTI